MKNISHRIVHFDLKGAPWKVPYLKEVIVAAKKWGATGILFEWEDSFPYTGHLITIGSLGGSSRDDLYSEDEITDLLQFTQDNRLEPIQLVQSLGHLEFVLKHNEFVHMRELREFPSVLCPTRPGGRELIVAMIHQLLAKQPYARFIHIGADEAWHMNKCKDCTSKTSCENYGVDSLFLDHIRSIVMDVHKTYPNVQILIWDDMLRGFQEHSIISAQMHKFVTPVVWNYGPVGGFRLDEQMWLKYEQAFTEVWVASAFKGANGGNQTESRVELYVSNQEAWRQQINKLEGARLMITGLILTGWSRFDHYATLCELLPVSLPSLASCLRMWTKPDGMPADAVVSASLPAAEWAGAECARVLRDGIACRQRCHAFVHGEMVGTWMNPWQVTRGYTNSMQVTPIAQTAHQLLREINMIGLELKMRLHALTGPRSVAEWIETYLEPVAASLESIARTAETRSRLPASVVPASFVP